MITLRRISLLALVVMIGCARGISDDIFGTGGASSATSGAGTNSSASGVSGSGSTSCTAASCMVVGALTVCP